MPPPIPTAAADALPAEALRLVADAGLTLATHAGAAVAVLPPAGSVVLWFSNDDALLSDDVSPEAYDTLVGPWVSVTYVDLSQGDIACRLFNALTGGVEQCGAEIVRRNGRLLLLPSPDGDPQALPDGIPVYLCSSGDGEVIAMTEEEYRDSLADGRSADTRLASAWYGEARQFKLRALARAAELAKAA